MDEEQQMIQLMEKLNGRYRTRIDDGTDYDDMRAMVKRCYALDRFFASQDSKKSQNPERRPRTARTGSTSSQGSNTSTRSSSSSNSASTSASSVASLPKLDNELRQKLRAEGRCFRCREKGHTSFNCPKNTNRINNVNHLAIMPAEEAPSEAGGVPLDSRSENE